MRIFLVEWSTPSFYCRVYSAAVVVQASCLRNVAVATIGVRTYCS